MKRGQTILGIPVMMVAVLIILFLVAILGFSSLSKISEKYDEMRMRSFFSSLDNSIQKQSKSSFGSVKDISLLAPKNIQGLCFVDKTKQFNALANTELNIVKDIFKDKNIYSMPFDKNLHNTIERFELKQDQNPLCIKTSGNKINLRLENNGNKTIIAPLSENDVTIDCTTISFNGEPDQKLDLVFIPYGYANLKKFGEDAENILYNTILTAEPFSSQKENINAFAVDVDNELQCTISSYISCDSHSTNSLASKCPHDYIFILVDRSKLKDLVSPVRSSAFQNIAPINMGDNQNVVLHELGHIFGTLADEYVDPRFTIYQFDISKYPNCDNSGCEKWNSIDGTECISGCTLGIAYRSAENTIMRSTKENTFGVLNEMILMKKLNNYEGNNENS